jgi:hypothetical protein
MLGKIYWNTADFEKDDSLALKLRLKRIEIFKSLIRNMTRPVKILDVGGTELFWKRMELKDDKLDITILNIIEGEETPGEYEYIEGDGRDMHMFPDNSFDLVFSNSVIEHAGSLDEQEKMAQEIQRVGKRYFIQTPHYYSPVEPHFFFPLFQFLPTSVKTYLLQHFTLGYLEKTPDKKQAREIVQSIRLLKRKELKKFFPDATIKTEKLYGFPVSYIIYE